METIINEEGGDTSFIYYKPNFLPKEKYEELKDWLHTNPNYKGGISFNQTEIPREQIWYQEEEKYFSKNWNGRIPRWESCSYDDYLKGFQPYIQDQINKLELNYDLHKPRFNSFLINKYRNGNDSIKPHRDNMDSFGEEPTVAVLSVGEIRNIELKRIKYNKENLNSIRADKTKQYLNQIIPLEPNSLFIMAGATQKYYSHEIKKCAKKDVRYSVTIREYL